MTGKTHLVLLPGLLCDARLWRHQAETLDDLAQVTIADLTGQDTMGAMAASVLDGAPETFALAGLSMGGYVALEVMRQAPDRVERLALLDTLPWSDNREQGERRREMIAMARRGDFKGITSRLLPLFLHPDRLGDRELTEDVMAMAEGVGVDAFLRQQNAIMGRPDSRRDLGLIHCPTLVLCGRQDILTPLAAHQEMAAAIPNSALVVIEDCGHLATMEQPHAVSAAMRYWLQV